MAVTGLVTDTTSCIPEELLVKYNITTLPLGFTIDGQLYWDRDLDNDRFWELFKNAKNMPTTNALNPAAVEEIFAKLAADGKDILCILVSKVLSASFAAAEKAAAAIREKYPERKVVLLDSKSSTGAMGFIVLEAARAVEAGKSFEAVVKVAEEMVPRVKYVTAMETMKYLVKIGRAPKTARIADVLQVKPIIGMVSGTGLVEPLGRRNGWKKAGEALVEMVSQYADTSKPLHVMVHYSDDINKGQQLKEMVTSRYNCAEVHFTPYSPVMASAMGPVVAVAFYS